MDGVSSTDSAYISWWQRKCPLFQAGSTYWLIHEKTALLPVNVGPCFIHLSRDECRTLLQDSGAWLLRYSSDPCQEQTEWWYVLCDEYDPAKLSGNTRSKLRRGQRRCPVRRVEPSWLAEHGYPCYQAAFQRYENAQPRSQDSFRSGMLAAASGPFEYWGVFAGEALAGYCRCALEQNYVATEVIKFDPAYLKDYSAYAMIGTLLQHYVVEGGLTVNNGNRPVSHDTQFQGFLLKLGFRRQFCRLNVVYRPWLHAAVRIAFPFRRALGALPDRGRVHRLQTLLFQEEIQRRCRKPAGPLPSESQDPPPVP